VATLRHGSAVGREGGRERRRKQRAESEGKEAAVWI
jgi:hypothetical protein